jgi:hypothetical protein
MHGSKSVPLQAEGSGFDNPACDCGGQSGMRSRSAQSRMLEADYREMQGESGSVYQSWTNRLIWRILWPSL